MIEVGTLDRVTIVLGERGMGKSTLIKHDFDAFRAETGGLIIGHSRNGQIGTEPDIVFHDDVERLQRGLRRHPAKIHLVTKGPAEPVLAYAEALSLAIRKRAWKRAHPLRPFNPHRPLDAGTLATPVMVLIDEGVAMKRHPSNEEMQRLEEMLTSARHMHLAVTWSIQTPTARQWILMEQGNRFRVFRYVHEWGGNALRAAGIPKEAVEEIRELPRFVYYHRDKFDPRTAGFRVVKKREAPRRG